MRALRSTPGCVCEPLTEPGEMNLGHSTRHSEEAYRPVRRRAVTPWMAQRRSLWRPNGVGRHALIIAVTALFALGLAGLSHSAPRKKKKGKTPRPSEISRSKKPPSAYHVFLGAPKDKGDLDKQGIKEAHKALAEAFTRPGYVIDTPEEKAPTDGDELARWLRDKDRTGLRLDVVIDPVKKSLEDKNERLDVTVRATVYTYPSGWLIMSTSGSAAAINDGWVSEEKLKQSVIAAAMKGMVENVAAYLAKKPVPIDR